MTKTLKPGGTIGIIGGGQLGQMMALSAKTMGFRVGVLDPTADCPASQVADWLIQGSYDDDEKLEELGRQSDVLTYEFENIDSRALNKPTLLNKLPQGLRLLEISQNRQREKECLNGLGLPTAAYCVVNAPSDLKKAIEIIGFPCVLKTCEGGYDGKGQIVLDGMSSFEEASKLCEHRSCVLEEWLTFDKEVSVVISGNEQGEYSTFPLAENEHHQNILYRSIVPAGITEKCKRECVAIGLSIAKALGSVGTIAVELFITREERIIVNEIAPRPHNSGHYSLEACSMSQFDAHIRGICGWGMPEVVLFSDVVMYNLIGEEQTRSFDYLNVKKEWFFHYYGKNELKKGRKMGHITILSESIRETLEEVERTTIWKTERK